MGKHNADGAGVGIDMLAPVLKDMPRCRKKGLSKELIRLVRALVKIKAEARKLGLWTDDRELLTCTRCGLEEDVACGGMLLVTSPADRGLDTGLRFTLVKKDGDLWRCPGCALVLECEWL